MEYGCGVRPILVRRNGLAGRTGMLALREGPGCLFWWVLTSKIGNRAVETVTNRRYREGMLSSIQAGFAALPQETSAALVCLGDQPLIFFSVFDDLIEAYEQTRKGIVLPVYKKRRGHPILIDMKHKQEILALSPDIGLRALVQNHPQDVQEVEVDTPQILKDIDYPEDYQSQLEKKEEE